MAKGNPSPLIPTWEDPDPLYKPIPRKDEITEKNAQMLSQSLHMIRANVKVVNFICTN